MRVGLLWIWATAVAGMFILYLIFNTGWLIVGPLDTAINDVMSSGAVDSKWVDWYYKWQPRLADAFGYLSITSLISLIIYIIVNSARREEDVYPVAVVLLVLLGLGLAPSPVAAQSNYYYVTGVTAGLWYGVQLNETYIAFQLDSNHNKVYLETYWADNASSGIIIFKPVYNKTVWLEPYPYPLPVLQTFRAQLTITEQSGQALSNYPVLVALNSSNFDYWDTDPSTIYFVDGDGSPLYYWIEYWNSTEKQARIWVNVTSIPAGSTTTIYMYFGRTNPYASYNDPDGVFLFYDDFSSGDLSKWSTVSGTVSVVLDGGNYVVSLQDGSLIGKCGIPHDNASLEFRYEIVSVGTYGPRFRADIRSNSAGDTRYGLINEIGSYSSNYYWLGKWVSGSATKLSTDGSSYSTGVWYTDNYIRAYGSTIEGRLGASSVMSASDTSIASGECIFFGTWDTGNNAYIDDVILREFTSPEPTVSVGSSIAYTLKTAYSTSQPIQLFIEADPDLDYYSIGEAVDVTIVANFSDGALASGIQSDIYINSEKVKSTTTYPYTFTIVISGYTKIDAMARDPIRGELVVASRKLYPVGLANLSGIEIPTRINATINVSGSAPGLSLPDSVVALHGSEGGRIALTLLPLLLLLLGNRMMSGVMILAASGLMLGINQTLGTQFFDPTWAGIVALIGVLAIFTEMRGGGS